MRLAVRQGCYLEKTARVAKCISPGRDRTPALNSAVSPPPPSSFFPLVFSPPFPAGYACRINARAAERPLVRARTRAQQRWGRSPVAHADEAGLATEARPAAHVVGCFGHQCGAHAKGKPFAEWQGPSLPADGPRRVEGRAANHRRPHLGWLLPPVPRPAAPGNGGALSLVEPRRRYRARSDMRCHAAWSTCLLQSAPMPPRSLASQWSSPPSPFPLPLHFNPSRRGAGPSSSGRPRVSVFPRLVPP